MCVTVNVCVSVCDRVHNYVCILLLYDVVLLYGIHDAYIAKPFVAETN